MLLWTIYLRFVILLWDFDTGNDHLCVATCRCGLSLHWCSLTAYQVPLWLQIVLIVRILINVWNNLHDREVERKDSCNQHNSCQALFCYRWHKTELKFHNAAFVRFTLRLTNVAVENFGLIQLSRCAAHRMCSYTERISVMYPSPYSAYPGKVLVLLNNWTYILAFTTWTNTKLQPK